MEKSESIGLYNTFSSAKKSQDQEKIPIPYLKIYSDRIILYPRIDDFAKCKKPHENSLKNLKKKKYQGNISKNQKRVIKQKLNAWLKSIIVNNKMSYRKYRRKDYYPVFITLTLSEKQKHTDKYIRRHMLELFIKNIKNRHNIKYYFWRAETQNNGNIHYHIIIDKYIRYQEIRDIWNKIQKRYGYLDNYFEKHGHIDANSTDVKGVHDVDNFINYILKYVIKDENNRKIQGKVYGLSDDLREINVYSDLMDNEMSDILIQMQNNNLTTSYDNEHFTVILFNKEFYESRQYELLEIRQSNYYYNLYVNLYERKKQMKKVINPKIERIKKEPEQLKLFSVKEKIKTYNHWKYLKSNILKPV